STISAREISDLSLTERIALTLANSISEDYQYGPDEASDVLRRPDFYIDEDEEVYSYSFRIKEAYHPRYGTFDGSGYYRIASSVRYGKPKTEEGWALVGKDETTNALIWFREIRKSGVQKYNEVQASLKSGNLTLTVSLRRPAEEPSQEAKDAVLERFNTLLESAKKHGILCRIVIELVESDEQVTSLADSALVNVVGKKNEETQMFLRVYTVDYKGSPVSNIDYYALKLKGALGGFARIENASFNEEKGQYEIHDVSEANIILVFPPLEQEQFARALTEDENLREGFGITMDVDVIFKSERG
ncbi:hypothetical protein IBX65_08840, partial [Candidatus Aerophobetes bacterium]|nr:hypothetical protein [Candidatus Aerophobetes bacterium]